MKRRGIYLPKGAYEEIKRRASGISQNLLIESILINELNYGLECDEIVKVSTTAYLSDHLYNRLQEEARKCGITTGHLIKYLLQRWFLREVIYAGQELEKV